MLLQSSNQQNLQLHIQLRLDLIYKQQIFGLKMINLLTLQKHLLNFLFHLSHQLQYIFCLRLNKYHHFYQELFQKNPLYQGHILLLSLEYLDHNQVLGLLMQGNIIYRVLVLIHNNFFYLLYNLHFLLFFCILIHNMQ